MSPAPKRADEWVWGWDPTPGIVSVWAEPDGPHRFARAAGVFVGLYASAPLGLALLAPELVALCRAVDPHRHPNGLDGQRERREGARQVRVIRVARREHPQRGALVVLVPVRRELHRRVGARVVALLHVVVRGRHRRTAHRHDSSEQHAADITRS